MLFDEFKSKYPYSADGSLPMPSGYGMLEPFTAIAFAAAVTTKIRLGTGICIVPQRSAIYTAKQVADCDVLSGGRVDFGVGIGWLREEFQALGVEFEGRATRTREYLAAMKSLWGDDVSEHQGHFLHIPPLRMFPKPLQQPHPPIVFGGHSDRALRRVADLGDGWFAFDVLPDEVVPRIEELNAVLSRRGRRPDSIEISASPYMKPGRDAATLRAYADAGVDQVIQVVFAASRRRRQARDRGAGGGADAGRAVARAAAPPAPLSRARPAARTPRCRACYESGVTTPAPPCSIPRSPTTRTPSTPTCAARRRSRRSARWGSGASRATRTCSACCATPRPFSSVVWPSAGRRRGHPPSMIFNDPPIHTRLRGLIAKAFTPRVVELQRASIAARSRELVDAMLEPEAATVVRPRLPAAGDGDRAHARRRRRRPRDVQALVRRDHRERRRRSC